MRRALALLLLVSCATRLPPLGAIQGVRPRRLLDVPSEALGETVSLSVQATPQIRRWVHGELLACDAEALDLLLHVERREIYLRVSWGRVRQVRVGEVPGNALVPTWTTMGALSSFSHGVWAVVSLPIWLAVGIPMSVSSSDARPRASGCDELRASARFPQGLPAAFRVRHFNRPAETSEPHAPRDAEPHASVAPWALHDAGDVPDAAAGAPSPSVEDAGAADAPPPADADAGERPTRVPTPPSP